MTGSPHDLEHFKRYGWKCNEDNLKTLPETAPQEARDLAQWLTLEGRRTSLEEWLQAVRRSDDGRIHGKFWPIGAWTHRMSHSKPNLANISSPFVGVPSTAVEEVKYKYDKRMRSLFNTNHYLIGTDADSIQLRILAHYMKSDKYVKAIVSGDKTLGTDIHNLNKEFLGTVCKSRDDAKTFIYAWLLGAGLPKMASILRATVAQAKVAESSFLSSLPELARLKSVEVKRDASRGYFIGLDGRKVGCTSEHLMLSGYLQNGESIIMKKANLKWRKEADRLDLRYRQVNFVHDEWQTECPTYDEAEEISRIQCDAISEVGDELGLFCPLSGSSVIGRNWAETH